MTYFRQSYSIISLFFFLIWLSCVVCWITPLVSTAFASASATPTLLLQPNDENAVIDRHMNNQAEQDEITIPINNNHIQTKHQQTSNSYQSRRLLTQNIPLESENQYAATDSDESASASVAQDEDQTETEGEAVSDSVPGDSVAEEEPESEPSPYDSEAQQANNLTITTDNTNTPEILADMHTKLDSQQTQASQTDTPDTTTMPSTLDQQLLQLNAQDRQLFIDLYNTNAQQQNAQRPDGDTADDQDGSTPLLDSELAEIDAALAYQQAIQQNKHPIHPYNPVEDADNKRRSSLERALFGLCGAVLAIFFILLLVHLIQTKRNQQSLKHGNSNAVRSATTKRPIQVQDRA